MATNEEDLDDELALFEQEIQKVTATSAPTSTKTVTSISAPENSDTTETNPQQAASHRWVWDGRAWRWLPHDASPSSQPANVPTITPQQAASPEVSASASVGPSPRNAPETPSRPTPVIKRTAAGQVWQDPSLQQWPQDDHRLFVGNLAPDATDQQLVSAFSKYTSFNMARAVREKRSDTCRGYGFISFSSAHDMLAAIKDMDGKYVGSRPVKLRRSSWQKRSLKDNKSNHKQLRQLRHPIAKR